MSLNPATIKKTDAEQMERHAGRLSPVNVNQVLDAHVVILNNYLRPHHVASYVELAKRIRKLTILLSVPMEPDRNWEAEWSGLDVRVQKNWMWRANWRHAAGFKEPNFIHIPYDTVSQLNALQPDIVFSYEMGMRTLFSSCYRRLHRSVPLVMVGNMADHIENARGPLRRTFRWIVKKSVDHFTYNGPSCRRYLESLSIDPQRLFHLPYCIDPEAVYLGKRDTSSNSADGPRRLFYGGAISERKGVLQFARALQQWSIRNAQRRIELVIAGTGELQSEVAKCTTRNLEIVFLGNCDCESLRNAYRDTDICVFPTLADEWGLVPIEAMASGLPVLGSQFAQSVETEVEDGQTGWVFDPTDTDSIDASLNRAMSCSPDELIQMGTRAKASVAHINAAATADSFSKIISTVLPRKQ